MIIISVLNIGVGYALAVYLGQGQLPWRVRRRQPNRAASTPPISASHDADDVPTDDDTLGSPESATDAENESMESIEAESTEEAVSNEPIDELPSDEAEDSSEEEASGPAIVDETDQADSLPPAEDAEQPEKVVTSEQVNATLERVSSELEEASSTTDMVEQEIVEQDEIPETNENAADDSADSEAEPGETPIEDDEVAVVEPAATAAESDDAEPAEAGDEQEEMLRGLEQFREQLQQQSSPTDQPVGADAADPSDDTKPTAPDDDEQAALDGIAAFQAQLEQQTAESSEVDPVETPPDNAESDEATTSDGDAPAPLDGEEALAGIEAFREQLAAMQDDSDATDGDEQSQQVAAEATS